MPKSRIFLGDVSIAFISLMISDIIENRWDFTYSFMLSAVLLSNLVGSCPFRTTSSFLHFVCLPGGFLEAVSKPRIVVEGKARVDEKAEHTR
jgi:hypothetical protein